VVDGSSRELNLGVSHHQPCRGAANRSETHARHTDIDRHLSKCYQSGCRGCIRHSDRACRLYSYGLLNLLILETAIEEGRQLYTLTPHSHRVPNSTFQSGIVDLITSVQVDSAPSSIWESCIQPEHSTTDSVPSSDSDSSSTTYSISTCDPG
jgi:hypothetical protein